MKKIFFLALYVLSQTSAMESSALLLEAAESGDLEVAKQALLSGADLEAQNNSGWTPLLTACVYGKTEIVELLLAAGSDVNGTDRYDSTPLMNACLNSHTKIVKILLAANANVNAQTSDGENALMRASLTEIVKLLLDAGADVNAKTHYGWTALTWSSYYGESEIIKLLIAAGIDSITTDRYGSWARMRAGPHGTLLTQIETFLDNPLAQIAVHPENKSNYLVWSIAYQEESAYNSLIDMYPELLSSTKSIIHCFLIAARVGNMSVFGAMKALLQARKPEAGRFVFLKALNLMIILHPELLSLLEQILAEEIAPLVVLRLSPSDGVRKKKITKKKF